MTVGRDAYCGSVRKVRKVRKVLRRDLAAAMKARDATSVSALRSALAAIENAEAVDGSASPPPATPDPQVAGSVAGLGKADVERRALADGEEEQLLRAEAEERVGVALDLERAGHHRRAARLQAEADVLRKYLPPS